jgi:hypothetical protein
MPDAVFGVEFDDAALAEDLTHTSAPGRMVALDARREFAAHGIAVALLRPCRDEGRDGTRLPGCVKTYLQRQSATGAWSSRAVSPMMVVRSCTASHSADATRCEPASQRLPDRCPAA